MMQTRILFGGAVLVLGLAGGTARGEPGELSPQRIDQIRSGFAFDADTRTKHNAVSRNDIDALALDSRVLHRHDKHFSHRIGFKGITNQKSSGRCWLFAGLNTLRPKVIHGKKLEAFEFSMAYLQFWDKMEKSNVFLETMIELRDVDFLDRRWQYVHEHTLGDGGWWNYVVGLVDKYGVVPKDVMPETHSSENTKLMNRVLERKLRADAVRLHALHRKGAAVPELRAFKDKALAEVYRFLAINLGEPPKTFTWRFATRAKDADENDGAPPVEQKHLQPPATYTPRQFYEAFVGTDLSQYVCLYSDPVSPFGRHYRFEHTRNMVGAKDMHFVNIEIDAMKTIAKDALLANEPVWFAADVGKDQSVEHGLMARGLYRYGPLFDLDLSITKADRIRYMAGASNHAMVFMGVDLRDGRPVKWLVENSWGEKKGDKGLWRMGDGWFDEHVYVIIVHRRHVPAPVLAAFEEEAKALPPWYPSAPVLRFSPPAE